MSEIGKIIFENESESFIKKPRIAIIGGNGIGKITMEEIQKEKVEYLRSQITALNSLLESATRIDCGKYTLIKNKSWLIVKDADCGIGETFVADGFKSSLEAFQALQSIGAQEAKA